MKIDKNKVRALLFMLEESFPFPVRNWEETIKHLGNDKSLIAYIVYLHDHAYIEGNIDFNGKNLESPWNIDLQSIRINAAGIDYINDMCGKGIGMRLDQSQS